jgi:hypothetical protein
VLRVSVSAHSGKREGNEDSVCVYIIELCMLANIALGKYKHVFCHKVSWTGHVQNEVLQRFKEEEKNILPFNHTKKA